MSFSIWIGQLNGQISVYIPTLIDLSKDVSPHAGSVLILINILKIKISSRQMCPLFT